MLSVFRLGQSPTNSPEALDKVVIELGMVSSVKAVQPEKVPQPIISFTELGKVALVKPVQPLETVDHSVSTELEMGKVVKPVQPSKALLPIQVTVFGTVTDFKPEQL